MRSDRLCSAETPTTAIEATIVTEASYHQLVRSLRKKFEEIGLPPQSIRTLPRFGLEYVREHPVVAAAPEPAAVDTPPPGAEPEAGARPAASEHVWRLVLTALPLLIGMLIGLKGYRDGQLPIDAVANDFGIHLFDIGGVQFDAELLQQIERRSSRGEYVYMARNGPKAWLGICTHPVQKDFSFCRQDYFSLY
jgi:cholera toxin transcriptional activator